MQWHLVPVCNKPVSVDSNKEQANMSNTCISAFRKTPCFRMRYVVGARASLPGGASSEHGVPQPCRDFQRCCCERRGYRGIFERNVQCRNGYRRGSSSIFTNKEKASTSATRHHDDLGLFGEAEGEPPAAAATSPEPETSSNSEDDNQPQNAVAPKSAPQRPPRISRRHRRRGRVSTKSHGRQE